MQNNNKLIKEKFDKIIKENNFLEDPELFENLIKSFIEPNKEDQEIIKSAIDAKTRRHITNSNLKIIESNEKLAQSNEKYQKAIIVLTWFLVITWILDTYSEMICLCCKLSIYTLWIIIAVFYRNRNSLFSKDTKWNK